MGLTILGSQSFDVVAAQAPASGAGSYIFLIIAVAFVAFIMWQNRSRQKRAAQFRASLRPGQRVQLAGGLIGELVSLGDLEARIELAPGVVVSTVPAAVQGIVPDLEAVEIADEITADDANFGDDAGGVDTDGGEDSDTNR